MTVYVDYHVSLSLNMADTLNLYSLNVRGLQSMPKRKQVLNWLERYNKSIILLQETHTSFQDEKWFTNKWNSSIFFSHGSTNSRGVCILVPRILKDHCSLQYKDTDGRILIIKVNIDEAEFFICNVYAPVSGHVENQVGFLKELSAELLPLKHSNLLLGGDWNVVLNSDIDKKGGHTACKNIKYRELLKNMFTDLETVDCWRLYHPNKKRYTWFQHHPPVFCRLDMWFVSDNLLNILSYCNIETGFKTDHSIISLSLNIAQAKRGRGLWKFNNSLLHDKDYVDVVKSIIIEEKNNMQDVMDKGFVWDYIKMRIRSDTILYSSTKKRLNHQYEKALEHTLNALEIDYSNNPSDNVLEEMSSVRRELESINNEKLNGAILRSKVVWAEHGEKNSKYFLNLEKHNYTNKLISKLEIEGETVTDPKEINKHIKTFYENLYGPNEVNDELLENVLLDIPKLAQEDSDITKGLITYSECLKSLKSLPNGKTPGIDGLTTDFYKFFWNDIHSLVLMSINYAFEKGEMSNDQKLGVITLLPKKDKIRIFLKNWRPITLLTVDYKLIAKSLAIRLETILPKYILETQFGYVKDRYIGENIRTVMDINYLCTLKNVPALAIQIDFEKAFDSINWNFMNRTLTEMGFSDDFLKWVKVLYKNTKSMAVNNGHLTESFNLYRGVHQGCPLSALLFIILVQVLTLMLNKRTDISGLRFGYREIKVLQMADDTTIFTSKKEDIGKILRLLKAFYNISGLKTNVDKTIAYTLGPMPLPERGEATYGLSWDNTAIKLLGITITSDEEISYRENFAKKIESIKSLTAIWSNRNLTMKGKITVTNSLLIPKLIYPCTLLQVPENVILEVEQLLKKFFWNWKRPKIKKDFLVRNIEDGGIKMPCFGTKVTSWKLGWAIRCLKNETEKPLWSYLVSEYLPEELTLEYLLKSRPTVRCLKEKCPILPLFYKDIVLLWVSLKNVWEVETKKQIKQECLWLNSSITVNSKVMYSKKCIKNNLLTIGDLLSHNGEFYELDELNQLYNVNWNFLNYLKLRLAIPLHWRHMLGDPHHKDVLTNNLSAKLANLKTLRTKDLYWILISKNYDTVSKPKPQIHWEEKYNIETDDFKYIYMLPYKSIRLTEIQTLQYKILYRIVNCNDWLYKISILDSPQCRFCNEIETLEHYFYLCNLTQDFWSAFLAWWNSLGALQLQELSECDILLGVPMMIDVGKILNACILLGKLCIYKYKSNNKQPNIYHFHCELQKFLKLEEGISLKNKTYDIFLNQWEPIIFL